MSPSKSSTYRPQESTISVQFVLETWLFVFDFGLYAHTRGVTVPTPARGMRTAWNLKHGHIHVMDIMLHRHVSRIKLCAPCKACDTPSTFTLRKRPTYSATHTEHTMM